MSLFNYSVALFYHFGLHTVITGDYTVCVYYYVVRNHKKICRDIFLLKHICTKSPLPSQDTHNNSYSYT